MSTSNDNFDDFIAAFRPSQNQQGTRSVLVVDDDEDVRQLVTRSMTALDPDLKIHEAENGQEALQVFDKIRSDDGADPVLIVTDLSMPKMDGWEFIDRLWEKFQQEGRSVGVPLIVLSASTGIQDTTSGKSVHGDRCKYKPLATVAKEDCVWAVKYDAKGEKGLLMWLKYFLRKTGPA
jgi:CheY-like chemotaxis protein